MTKIPHSPEEIFDEFVADVKGAFGKELISIILYGSGAKGEYVRKKSDINFLIILSEEGILNLSKAFGLVKKWRKRNVSAPLFMTESYLESSLDSFPIEFLSMQQHHKVVFGKDVLANLQISNDHLRLQFEEQIKGKLLHLRNEFLAAAGDKRLLRRLISATVPTFASLFNALLTLKDIEPPKEKTAVLQKAAEAFDLKQDVFKQVIAIRENSVKLSGDELVALTEKYIAEIRKLAFMVDKW
jgi:predicted nucleotidyltransferase